MDSWNTTHGKFWSISKCLQVNQTKDLLIFIIRAAQGSPGYDEDTVGIFSDAFESVMNF